MDVLTFNLGKSRRGLVSDVQNFNVDFSDSKYSWIQARQYEDQMRQVQVNVVNEDGSPFDLTGCNYVFEGLLPDNTHRIYDATHGVALDPVNGQFRFDFPAPVFAVAGSYKQAFFRIYRDGKNISTLEFSLEVLADKVISGIVASDYITPFNDLYDQLASKITNAGSDIAKALQEWTDKYQSLFTDLSTQSETAATTLKQVQSAISTLETQIKSDGLLKQGDVDDVVNTLKESVAGYTDLKLSGMYFPKLTNYQEDCGLLCIAGKWILIDNGWVSDWTNIKAFILKHTNKLDIGIISHFHEDHCGNTKNIIADGDIDTSSMTWYLEPIPTGVGADGAADIYTQAMDAAKIPYQFVDSDLKVELDDNSYLQMLNTSAESYAHYTAVKDTDYNDYSMVTLAVYNKTRLFFAGDIRNEGTSWMVAHYSDYLAPVDFLKINHHAFDRGNNAQFFVSLKPTYAIAMLIKNNYVSSTSTSRGVDSTALNVLSGLGTTTSYAMDKSVDYSVGPNGVNLTAGAHRLRGTVFPAEIDYYLKAAADYDPLSDGSQDHPFNTFDEAMSYIQDMANVSYVLNVGAGAYGDVVIQNIHVPVSIVVADGVTFNTIDIANMSALSFSGDVHTTAVRDRTLVIDHSFVTFNNSVINDDTTASVAHQSDSRFICVYLSTVVINKVIVNHRSVGVGAYNGSQVTAVTIQGADNNIGLGGFLGTVYTYDMSALTATTPTFEIYGRVIANTPWTDLTMTDGYVGQDLPLQYKIKDGRMYLRGNIKNANWLINDWVTIATLPDFARVSDNFNYRFASETTNGSHIVISIEGKAIKTYCTSLPNLVSFSVDYEI